MEPSPEPHRLKGTHFDEDQWLSQNISADDINTRHYLTTNKFILAYHYDRDEVLDDFAAEAEKYLVGGPGLLSIAQFYCYQALAGLRQLVDRSAKFRDDAIELAEKNLRWMRFWSEITPTTFQHKHDLMAAEKARVTDDIDEALSFYEQAINGARENGFTHEEALANELYARFWMERGNERLANLFMREAHSLYRKWGALAKVEHLTKRYPNLVIGRTIAEDETRPRTVFDHISSDLDLITVLKASQAIAGEIELSRLLGQLMTSAIENSGAQRGFLILPENEQWIMVARSELDKTDVEI